MAECKELKFEMYILDNFVNISLKYFSFKVIRIAVYFYQ